MNEPARCSLPTAPWRTGANYWATAPPSPMLDRLLHHGHILKMRTQELEDNNKQIAGIREKTYGINVLEGDKQTETRTAGSTGLESVAPRRSWREILL